ncbi:MAG TPA: hypothetical protein VFR09_07405 [Alphaproteobacteria bacterium]|nr:hypothetical protein [Alphaproteobacteria bacterium]
MIRLNALSLKRLAVTAISFSIYAIIIGSSAIVALTLGDVIGSAAKYLVVAIVMFGMLGGFMVVMKWEDFVARKFLYVGKHAPYLEQLDVRRKIRDIKAA